MKLNNYFFQNKKIRTIVIGAAIIFLVAAFFLKLSLRTQIIVEDAKTGEIYLSCPLRMGGEFSVEFIHSVNKSPVEDFYQVRKDGIYVVRTKYYGFGAGVQTELEDGQILTYEDNGSSMVISGIDRRMDDLQYIVGTVSDHVLRIGGKEISLRDTCGRNTRVRIHKK